jgi:hypothetical protein
MTTPTAAGFPNSGPTGIEGLRRHLVASRSA